MFSWSWVWRSYWRVVWVSDDGRSGLDSSVSLSLVSLKVVRAACSCWQASGSSFRISALEGVCE